MKQSTLTDKTTRRARSFSTACAEWWADLRSLKNQRLRQIIFGWSVWDTSSSYTTDLTAQRIASCKKKLPFTKTSFDYKRMPCKSLYQMDEYKSAREQYAPQMSCKTSTLPLLLIHTQIYKLWASKTLSKLQLMITLSYVSLNAPWNTLPKHQVFRFLYPFHLLLNACSLLSLNYEFPQILRHSTRQLLPICALLRSDRIMHLISGRDTSLQAHSNLVGNQPFWP